MSSKSFYSLFILLFTFTFVSCATIPFEKNKNVRFKQKYEMVLVEENLDYLNSKIEYPRFENIPELNKRIENTIINNWKSFKSYSRDEWKEIVALNTRGSAKLPPFEYIVSCEVTGNKNIISVLINTYVFNGGAHGNTSLTSFNYNSSEKTYMDIKKASGMSYKDISEICRQYLYKKLIDDNKKLPPKEKDAMHEMINTGAFPQASNFEIFTVDGNKIFVFFEPYTVAPYSYGIQKIQIN